MGAPKESPEYISELRFWAQQGFGSSIIADKMGLAAETIRQWAKKHNIELPQLPTAQRIHARLAKIKREQDAPLVRQLAADGYGAYPISQIMGTQYKRVKQIAAEHGIELPEKTRHELRIPYTPSPESTAARAAQGRARSEYVEWQGERIRLKDHADKLGMTTTSLKRRIKNWGLERAMTRPKTRPEFRTSVANETRRRLDNDQGAHC